MTAAGVPFERVDVPPLIPRKELEALGIYYRRVPILAVGKDVYCDSKGIFDVVLNKLAPKNAIARSTAVSYPNLPNFWRMCTDRNYQDWAWEEWGFNAFADTLGLAPSALMSDEFVKVSTNPSTCLLPSNTQSDMRTGSTNHLPSSRTCRFQNARSKRTCRSSPTYGLLGE